jgi:hypothetical protein
MSRASLLKAVVSIGIAAGLAACDAPSGALAPRTRDITPTVLRIVTDSTKTTKPTSANTTDDELTCRGGYQIAYRDDGTWYCEPIGGN